MGRTLDPLLCGDRERCTRAAAFSQTTVSWPSTASPAYFANPAFRPVAPARVPIDHSVAVIHEVARDLGAAARRRVTRGALGAADGGFVVRSSLEDDRARAVGVLEQHHDLEEVRALLRPTSEANAVRRAELENERAKLTHEIENLTEAIAAGEALNPAIGFNAEEGQAAGRHRRGAGHLDRVASMGGSMTLQDELQAYLADWQGLLRSAPIQGRQIIRKLLVGRLTVTPQTHEGGRYYEFSGEATLGRLLAGVFGVSGVVAPTGFEPVFQP